LLTQLISDAPNLVEGRELNGPVAVAFDFSVTPPILYVADTFNNRVLAFNNPNNFTACGISAAPTCGYATLAISQPTGSQNLLSTLAGGPGTNLSTGLNLPTSVAVDSSGNLYVLDAGNNRILRFPKPLTQPSTAPLPVNLVIGQMTTSSGSRPNQGQTVPSATSLASVAGGSVPPFASLAFDPSGNLWVSDPGNNRVLRFPASQLQANTSLPTADIVLGQTGFNLSSLPNPPSGTPAQEDTLILYEPGGIAFAQNGDLYVADNYSRVLYFTGSQFTSGDQDLQATRILGLIVQIQGQPTVTYPNNYTLVEPTGLFTVGNNLFVADTGNNRVVEYDVPANWPAAPNPTQLQQQTAQVSPPMLALVGQTSFTAGQNELGQANQGLAQPTASTLSSPFGGAVNGTDIWIADSGNNRVLSFVQQNATYSVATRLVGQLDYPYRSVNLIEGKEVYLYSGVGYGGVAIDYHSSPPHLYIADSFNNRILCFNDARSVTQNSTADLVIGQTGPYFSLINSPTNLPAQPTQTGLNTPIGVAVDANGNLYVADSGNGRVVRFPAPFNQPAGQPPTANLVLGQAAFTGTPVTDPSQSTMRSPWGIALFSECFSSTPATCSLAVSDVGDNRVLIFKANAGSDFTNGQPASIVLGQQTFNTTTPSQGSGNTPASTAGFYSPTHIAVDTSDRLFVCDTSNSRVLAFTNTTNLTNGSSAALPIYGLSSPQGITVNQSTGEIWVANTNASQIWRLPEYSQLILTSNPNNPLPIQTLYASPNPLALTLDAAGNPVVLEAANRVSFYYAALLQQNVANYNSAAVAPGQLTVLYRAGLAFSNATPASATSLPWPTTLGGLQVLVNGVAAPLFAVTQGNVYFQVPTTSAIPQSGTANFVVMNATTGEIIAAGTFNMTQFNPGFFTSNAEGTGQVAAYNVADSTINGPGNGVSPGQYIAFCLTGGGVFTGGPNPPPADGAAPDTAATAMPPVIEAAPFNGAAPASDIQYSGAGCGFPGGWQINFLVTAASQNTQGFAPGANLIVLTINGVPSSIGPAGTVGSAQVTFYVKQ
jgi:uncharacterized protein (TIGR03437 family)